MSVNPVRRRLAALAVLLLGLGAALLAPAAAAADTTSPVPPKTLVANRIVVERTGGVTGQPQISVVDTTTPHPDAPRLLRLAASREFVTLKPVYLPDNTCCDFFFYTVTVSYNLGTTKVVHTMEGASAPDVLWNVIILTQAIGGNSARATG